MFSLLKKTHFSILVTYFLIKASYISPSKTKFSNLNPTDFPSMPSCQPWLGPQDRNCIADDFSNFVLCRFPSTLTSTWTIVLHFYSLYIFWRNQSRNRVQKSIRMLQSSKLQDHYSNGWSNVEVILRVLATKNAILASAIKMF